MNTFSGGTLGRRGSISDTCIIMLKWLNGFRMTFTLKRLSMILSSRWRTPGSSTLSVNGGSGSTSAGSGDVLKI